MHTRLAEDFKDDSMLMDLLCVSKENFQIYYSQHYKGFASESSNIQQDSPEPTIPSGSFSGSPQKRSFTSRYRNILVVKNELEEFFKLSPEDIDHCDPIQWWFARRAQFPRLFRFARDILAIPGVFFLLLSMVILQNYLGSAVAVERVFSGGRDTISLRRASLNPNTIRALMVVKHRLRLARNAVLELTGDD
jgi:hypothetical protein